MTTPLRRTRRGPSGRYLLLLVALCPRIPSDCIAGILRHRSEASTRQLLARVSAAGLISFERARAGSVLGGGAFRMWFLTKTGVRAVTDLAETEPSCALLDGVTFTNSGRRRGIVPLVAAYRALAASSATFASRPIVRVWEQPWIRWYQSSADRVVRVRLPAGVVLESSTAVLQPIVLLPDTGTRPVASYRTTLRRFGELERQSRGDELPYLMIVLLEAADCEARAAAWSGFIARHLGPGYARVISETRVRDRWMISRAETPRKPSSIPQADTMLDLMARHPLLTCDQLATLLDASRRRVSALQTELVRRGWLRQLTADATRLDPTPPRHPRLFELTLAGRRQSLRRLGLMSTDAARHHGHLPHRSTARRRLLRHLAHTVGANQFFVDLALIARRITLAGGDDELLEWRSAAACARGKCRPDGYGCYRRGDTRYGFFVEYDRATERAREYAAKLDAFYRFRDTGAAAREFASFPTVLVVSTSARAEDLIAYQAHLAVERHGGSPLPVLLTTTGLVQTTLLRMLGPVWRAPSLMAGTRVSRGDWLPALPARVARQFLK